MHRPAPLLLGIGCVAAIIFISGTGVASGHPGTPIAPPPTQGAGDASAWEAGWLFSGYGLKHILLGYDHLLFLAGLALVSRRARDVIGVIGVFAIAYSSTLIGGTLAGVSLAGDLIDAVIALSVGFVGAQIAFGKTGGLLGLDPRWPALSFGLAHGLGLSALLQELRLPEDDLLPSILGFNAGVELGQIAVLAGFIALLRAIKAFPFPARQRIPAGFALMSASSFLLAFVVLGVSL